MQLMMAVTMQEEDPAGWEQMWESWMSRPPHFCPQLVSFTKLNPTWCNRFGSMVSRQDRTGSHHHFTTAFISDLVSFFAASQASTQTSTGLCHQRTNLSFNEPVYLVPLRAGPCMEPTRTGSVGRGRDLILFLLLWMEATFCFR